MEKQNANIRKRLQHEFQDDTFVARELTKMRQFSIESGWKKLQDRIEENNRQGANLSGNPFINHTRSYVFHIISIAAILLILIGAGFLWYKNDTSITPVRISKELAEEIKKSTQRGDTGAQISQIDEPDLPVHIANDIRQSRLMNEEVKKELLNANNVKTYINKEYWLTLPDGTIVHLANNSRLIYPETFHRKHRDVYLEGEAYFIVGHSKGNTFTVHTSKGDISDYGTEFNVDARDKQDVKVVLIEGSIGVMSDDGLEQKIAPGEMAVMTGMSIQRQKADLAPYLAWKTGKVEFQDWTLERLMKVIEKWYSIKVVFNDEATRKIKVSGDFERESDLVPTIDALNTITGLNMSIIDKTVVVK